MNVPKLLILNINSENTLSDVLRGILESLRLSLETLHAFVEEGDQAFENCVPLSTLTAYGPQLVFLVLPTDLLNQADNLVQLLKKNLGAASLFLVTDGGKPEEIFALLRSGLSDYITPPLNPADIYPRIWRLLEQTARKAVPKQEIKEHLEMKHLIGKNKVFKAEINRIPTIAKYDSSVLILGETGTGKEMCVRAIHHLSPRANKPFVSVNCAAIPLELLENELFGHERGAFTSAHSSQLGLISEADGGTILLDEIDSLPPLAQVKLLRFIQEKEYRPLGSTKKREADVRVIAATNVNIEKAIREKRFRQDLYYRINVVQLTLPPLRERKEDIPLLAQHFLTKYATKFNKQAEDFSLEAVEKLMSYNWPGNVRELEHIIERAVIFSEHQIIRGSELSLQNCIPETLPESLREAKNRVIRQFEKAYIEKLLIDNRGNITKAALAAHKNRRAFFELIRKHDVDVQSFKAGGLET